MTVFALVLVLAAATFHATWNLLAKRAGDGGAVFVWLFGFLAMLIYAPLAVVVVLLERPYFGPEALVFMFGSGVLHLGYFVLLQRGYAIGDLSLVYPLARGTGPLLATAAAIVLLGERPGTVALLGIALITIGVFMLTMEPGNARKAGWGKSVVYGLLTGAFIAAYTIWDKHAVSALLIRLSCRAGSRPWSPRGCSPPGRAPSREGAGDLARTQDRGARRRGAQPALVYPGPYGARLHACKLRGSGREISILIGAAMGASLLAEGDVRRRLVAATVMVLGFAALALG